MLFAIMPVEESQPDPVGRTRRPRPPTAPERRPSRCAMRAVGGVGNAHDTGISGRSDPSIVYPKAYPERFTAPSREVTISYKSFILFVIL
jgi:hypothetical protein